MARLKYRSGNGFEEILFQGPISSTWVNVGNLAAGDLQGYDIDISGLGYSAEPQVWFQTYQCALIASIYNVTPTSCRLWLYNPTKASTTGQGWLKTCRY